MPTDPTPDAVTEAVRTFAVYRRGDLSATHNADQVLPADVPHFEGVVFSDGHCVVRWMTLSHSTAVWPSFDDLWRIHGHDAPDQPHGTVIVWHDAALSSDRERLQAALGEAERERDEADERRYPRIVERLREAKEAADLYLDGVLAFGPLIDAASAKLTEIEAERDAAEARATAAEGERDELQRIVNVAHDMDDPLLAAEAQRDAATTRAEHLSAVVEAVRALIRDRADYTPQGLCDEIIWHIIDADRAPTTGEGT